jgi:hypothetical protein
VPPSGALYEIGKLSPMSDMMTIRITAGACVVLGSLMGCEAGPGGHAVPAVAAADESGPSSAPSAPIAGNPTVHADLQSIVEAARRDAASRSGVSPEAIKVLRAERVTWSDGSLGCPLPGMMYTQALVPGFRVILDAGGQVLDYHAGASGHLVLCPAGRAVEPRADERI